MSFEELVFVLLDFRASLSQHFDLIRHPYDESLRDNVTTGEQGADYVRVERSDPRQTSFPMRQVFKKVRKILGRDLTPQKSQRECRTCSVSQNGGWGRKRGSTTSADAADASDRRAGWVSFLNRCQFCRRQNVWFER